MIFFFWSRKEKLNRTMTVVLPKLAPADLMMWDLCNATRDCILTVFPNRQKWICPPLGLICFYHSLLLTAQQLLTVDFED